MGKTETIKKRRIDVYLPTMDAKSRWGAAATRRRQKVSEMVFELVEIALAPVVADSSASAHDLLEEIDDLRAELDAQRARNDELELLKENLEHEISQYRAEVIADSQRLPKLDSRLIRLFSQAKGKDGKYRVLGAADVRKALRATGKNEAQSKAMHISLEAMELHGWIKRSAKGWVWSGE